MIITIAHQKGGVGKSTLAANLAVMLQRVHGDKLRVIDLDTQRSLSYFNEIRKQKGHGSLPIIKVEKESELKQILENDPGMIIIDAGGFDAKVNRISMLYSDLIITPVSDSPFELGGLMKFQEIIQELRVARPNIVATVLLNKVHPFASGSLEQIFDYAKNEDEFDFLETIIRDRGDFKKSVDYGQSVDEYAADGKAAEEMKTLLEEINGKIQ